MTVLRRGWLHLASGAGIGRVFGFASNLLLTRWLGPTELGLFNLVTTTVQTSDTLVRCGGDYALSFELGGQPEAIETESGIKLARGLSQICSLMTALISVGVGIWVWLGQGLFPLSLSDHQRFILTALLLLMIAFEGSAASAWEVLLVSHRTAQLALRQGLFVPLRLLFAACGALLWGVLGAMIGWSILALIQGIWLRRVLGNLWRPFQVFPLLGGTVSQLLRRGLPFYGSNLLSSIIFYPLLINVASEGGLAEIGYLRAGQVLQQIFAFLPATLVPVLFLNLRSQPDFSHQAIAIEKPFRLIWFFLLEVLLLYCMLDRFLIAWIFGDNFASALLPTRLLLLTSLFECLAQLLVQPILAAGHTRLYGFWQNGTSLISAALGWFWIPVAGLPAYLIVRLLYVVVPLIGLGIPVVQDFHTPQKIIPLALASIVLLGSLLSQVLNENSLIHAPLLYLVVLILIIFAQRKDARFIGNEFLRSRS